MPTTITDKQSATKDSGETLLYVVDYDALTNLAAGVELTAVGTFTITPTGLTQASQALLTGNRKARVLLSGGTVGVTYTIEHTATTNETPAQVKSKWWRLQIT